MAKITPYELSEREAVEARELGRRLLAERYSAPLEAIYFAIAEEIGDREWQPQALALISVALRGAADHLIAEADELEARVQRGIDSGTICPGCGDPEGEQCCDAAPRRLAA